MGDWWNRSFAVYGWICCDFLLWLSKQMSSTTSSLFTAQNSTMITHMTFREEDLRGCLPENHFVYSADCSNHLFKIEQDAQPFLTWSSISTHSAYSFIYWWPWQSTQRWLRRRRSAHWICTWDLQWRHTHTHWVCTNPWWRNCDHRFNVFLHGIHATYSRWLHGWLGYAVHATRMCHGRWPQGWGVHPVSVRWEGRWPDGAGWWLHWGLRANWR